MIYAKQSTAIIVTVGPVLDADGVAVTDCVVADFKASKNGGAPAALDGSATLTHRHTGHYSLSLTATDVNTLGTVEIVIDDTVNACPVKEIVVLPAAAYDALVGGSGDGIRADVRSLAGVAQSLTDLKHFADSGYDPATAKVEGVKLADTLTTYAGNTPQTGDSFARLGAPAGASHAADVAAVKGDTAAIQTKTDALPADPASETNVDAVETKVDAVQAKTDNLPSDPADQSIVIAATDAVMARIGAPVGADLVADVAAVKADAVAIKAKSDNLPADPASQAAVLAKLPAALVGGKMDSVAELPVAERAAVADKLLGRTRAGGADGGRTVAQCLAFGRNKWAIAGGTLTVYADDDSTPLYTATIATAPGDPITESTPV